MKRSRLHKTSKRDPPKLKRKLDRLLSLWVRKRSNQCFTCGNPGNQAGHFQRRRFGMTRFHPKNLQTQCARCNVFQDGEQYEFGRRLDITYGPGTAEQLRNLARKNNYQDEAETILKLIEALKGNYEEEYEKIMEKYL